jgi:guanylate kinase
MDRGPLIVVSGPSGVGKTTVVEELLRRERFRLRRAVTATTRDPRPGEVDDSSYHFKSRDEFRKAIDDGSMLEWELVFGMDFYGTPRSEVDPYLAAGTGVILVVDVKGAARVRRLCPNALSVFIRPPSFEELEARLRGRGDLSEERIQRRLTTAREEMARSDEFDHVIINAELDRAVAELERLVETAFTKGV